MPPSPRSAPTAAHRAAYRRFAVFFGTALGRRLLDPIGLGFDS